MNITFGRPINSTPNVSEPNSPISDVEQADVACEGTIQELPNSVPLPQNQARFLSSTPPSINSGSISTSNGEFTCPILQDIVNVKKDEIIFIQMPDISVENADNSYWIKDDKVFIAIDKDSALGCFTRFHRVQNPLNRARIHDNIEMYLSTPETHENPEKITQDQIISMIHNNHNEASRQTVLHVSDTREIHHPSLLLTAIHKLFPNTTMNAIRRLVAMNRRQVGSLSTVMMIGSGTICLSCVVLLTLGAGSIALPITAAFLAFATLKVGRRLPSLWQEYTREFEILESPVTTQAPRAFMVRNQH